MKQPEALHHADYIEYWNPDDPIAKELRRLHEANQAMLEALKAIRNSPYMPSALVGLIDVVIENGEQQ